MIFAHFALVHALWGGFFGWWGVLGSLLPDMPGVIGWRRAIRFHSTRWWDYMPDWARSLYGETHRLWCFWLLFCLALTANFFLWEATEPALQLSMGYLLHILLDIPTHRGDPSRTLREARPDVKWGVNWYQAPYFWTEWVSAAIVLYLVFALKAPNVWFDWLRVAKRVVQHMEKLV